MLHYRSFGEGKTLVFLHGFLESSTMWDHLPLQDLNAHCIFIDLPGHGKSPLNDLEEIPSIRFMADEVLQVLNALQVNEFTVVGHSLGAYVGLELAQLPACQKLIFLNSNCWSDDEQKRRDRPKDRTFPPRPAAAHTPQVVRVCQKFGSATDHRVGCKAHPQVCLGACREWARK